MVSEMGWEDYFLFFSLKLCDAVTYTFIICPITACMGDVFILHTRPGCYSLSLSRPVDVAEIHKSSTMSFFNSVPEHPYAAEVSDLG